MSNSDKVVDHFNTPRIMGIFQKGGPGVGTEIVGAVKIQYSALAEDAITMALADYGKKAA